MLGRARKYGIIVSLTTFLLTALIIRMGIENSYPHPALLSIVVVGIGCLMGLIAVSIDGIVRERRLLGSIFRIAREN